MREIRFRGKSIEGFGNNLVDTWFYGGIITNPHGNEVHIAYFDKGMLSWRNVPVDPETVGQYTGLKDQMQEEIYDGDMLQDDEQCLNVVEWNEDVGGWVVRIIMNDGSKGYVEHLADYHDMWVKVSNIHDNYPGLTGN